ncbi:MAG: hypothetical protein B6U78_02660 [Candidatus Aenigmarchaeota archaeon ex4484_224]|nr:MAG: hypothetical protein B6U78_02660 [Candidatus Aenigmarchaeota archaeon ex4484_224]
MFEEIKEKGFLELMEENRGKLGLLTGGILGYLTGVKIIPYLSNLYRKAKEEQIEEIAKRVANYLKEEKAYEK